MQRLIDRAKAISDNIGHLQQELLANRNDFNKMARREEEMSLDVSRALELPDQHALSWFGLVSLIQQRMSKLNELEKVSAETMQLIMNEVKSAIMTENVNLKKKLASLSIASMTMHHEIGVQINRDRGYFNAPEMHELHVVYKALGEALRETGQQTFFVESPPITASGIASKEAKEGVPQAGCPVRLDPYFAQ